MGEPIIHIQNVNKSYRIYSDKYHTLKERLLHFGNSKYSVHPVLTGVNFEVEKGKAIALIGENGSGKSTLLKLMSGIIYPDKGKITMSGKVSSLLELGAGFHPDFSGRENIYNNASIFGLSRRQIDERYDRIVAFSELEEFIDNPVRTYSSGMYMRLAFSVAINVDADILLIDEILAVGDAHFQNKCLNMIRQLKSKGVTIILVTHDMGAVERICDYTVWLEAGTIRESGESREIIDMYLLFLAEKNGRQEANQSMEVIPASADGKGLDASDTTGQGTDAFSHPDKNGPTRWGNRSIEITNVLLLDKQKQSASMICSGESLEIVISYLVNHPVDSVVFGYGINNLDGLACVATNTYIRHVDLRDIGQKGEVCILIDSLLLTDGTYSLETACHAYDGLPYDFRKNCARFDVYSHTKDAGIYIPEQKWMIRSEEK